MLGCGDVYPNQKISMEEGYDYANPVSLGSSDLKVESGDSTGAALAFIEFRSKTNLGEPEGKTEANFINFGLFRIL